MVAEKGFLGLAMSAACVARRCLAVDILGGVDAIFTRHTGLRNERVRRGVTNR